LPAGLTASVLIARHGETPSNVARRYAGWSDEGLTERGKEQARALGAKVRGLGITRVRSSAIARAAETAAIVGRTLRVPVQPDERLNELRMGPWEGLTEDEVAVRFPREYALWSKQPDRLRLDGRETLDQLAMRVRAVLDDSVRSGESELIVTHVALVRVALLLSTGGSLRRYRRIPVENCQLIRLLVGANGNGVHRANGANGANGAANGGSGAHSRRAASE
jgi:broad specificity phosphatase PhoE